MSEGEQGTVQERAGAEAPGLAPEDFDALRALIHREAGIALSDAKRDMLHARLARRLRELGLTSYGEYYRHVLAQGAGGPERQELINRVTTNKTDFFREPHHFAFLRDIVLPSTPGRLRAWSAGCSTGEEPYTLAMCLRDHFGDALGRDIEVLATDIDTDVLARAARGVYDEGRIAALPPAVRRGHFLRGTGANAGLVAVCADTRRLVTFRQVNLIAPRWPMRGPFDVIFCRNVLIYFDRATQARLLARFAELLAPGGHLFLGHSESACAGGERYESLGDTVFRLRDSVRPTGEAPVWRNEPPVQTLIVGDVVACDRPAVLKTLLGSCVSACVYDPQAGVGGMNHFSLPAGPADEGACARYGVHAMELLVNEVMKRGGERRRLCAKVFGGARVLEVDADHLNIGDRNARFVLDFLRTEGVPVVAKCLGGASGLRVHFHPHTGRALVKPLDGRLLAEVARDEAHYGEGVRRDLARPCAGSVTLF